MPSTLLADVRYAVRVLFRAPAFAGAVVLVLGLGIGANTAIFSIVNAALLRPLPYPDADGLVRLFHEPPQSTFPGIHRFSLSPANFYDWQREARSFDGMALYRFRQFVLTGGGNAESVLAAAVGADFFRVLSARPALGRVFVPDEDGPGAGHVAILSDAFWKSHFGGAPDTVGRTLTLNEEAYTVVGVMPADFSLATWAASDRPLWVPLALTSQQRTVRANHNMQAVARLKPGVTVHQAQSELDRISTRLALTYPQDNAGWGATVVEFNEQLVGDARRPLLTLLCAVGLVLLIACANVGNLLFARALARRKELAIRTALGAGRVRVFQQLVVEAMVLAAAGGALGLLLARVAIDAATTLLIANHIPRAEEIAIDARVLLFAASASVLTGILAGALPAVRAGRSDVNEALKEGGRSDSAVGVRTRRLLIVGEVALSVVLLMGAGLMVRTVVALRTVDAGFDPQRVLTMRITPRARYTTPEQFAAIVTATLERLRALPGVESGGAIDDLPVQGGSVQPIVLEGRAELLPKDQPTVRVRKITPGYITSMRIPLLRGRDVAPGEVEGMLVSRSAAKLLWGDEDPIGRRVRLPLESKTALRQVVGVVGDVKQEELSHAAQPTVYEHAPDLAWGTFTVTLRAAVPPQSVAQAAVAAVHAIDPGQPVEDVRPMQDVVDETLTSQRFSALLLALFAAVALALASVGIYSVLSYIVRGRSREIGIRTALGAKTGHVLRIVIAEGMVPACAGIAIGAGAALASARVMSNMVFGVSAADPWTLAAVSGLLAVVALLASVVPAYRASRLDPLTVLRGN